jgi:two-component system sensor histidine kinase KdpD
LIEEEERARAAAESERLKSSFLAAISHDLRTPLTAIRTAAVLLHSDPDRAAKREAREHIEHEIDRLNRLVEDLLEMSRLEGGGGEPNRVPEDVAELVGATAVRMQPLTNGRRLELFATDDLPLVALDAAQMGRALTNLIENAIKFSPPASVMSIAVTSVAGEVLIRTHNAGEPIPADEQEQIFTKFHRIQRNRDDAAGTGLGLAICKGIVEAHGGRIWTRNEDGGVAFYIALPALPAEEPVDAPSHQHEVVTA